MSNSIVRQIGKRCFLLLYARKPLLDAGVMPKILRRANLRQCPPCIRSYHQVRKTSTRSFASSSSSSSNSSSSSKLGFVGWYLRKLETQPVVTKSISSSVILLAADLTAQTITLPSPSASYDLKRTFRMATYGLLILGPSQHLWFNFISKVLPKTDMPTTLKKLFMGQAVYGPILNTVFFSYNSAVQGESGPEIVAKLKRDLLPTILSNATFWPVCDFVTFKFVPVQLQPLMNSSWAFVWSIYLTYLASR